MIQVLLIAILIVLILIVLSTADPRREPLDLSIQQGIGPMISLNFGSKSIQALVDTGSIYIMSSVVDDPNSKECSPSLKEQVYHYAGPSAQFSWVCNNPTLGDKYSLGEVPVGYVSIPSSQQALGLPAVIGLSALPEWASQRFGSESLVNYLGLDEFWFFLKGSKPQLLLDRHSPDNRPKCFVPINPQISLPTPGLGYLTTAITRLDTVFTDGTKYSIWREPASDKVAQTSSFFYTINDEAAIPLEMVEWYCLFDTGTWSAIFFADASVNLLGAKVTESIIPGQMDSSDYTTADVTYTFGKEQLVLSSVSIPTVLPSQLDKLALLMTVCGFQSHMDSDVRYQIEDSLPKSVTFY